MYGGGCDLFQEARRRKYLYFFFFFVNGPGADNKACRVFTVMETGVSSGLTETMKKQSWGPRRLQLPFKNHSIERLDKNFFLPFFSLQPLCILPTLVKFFSYLILNFRVLHGSVQPVSVPLTCHTFSTLHSVPKGTLLH